MVKIKNRFINPSFGNYRDLLIYITLPFSKPGFICEIQINYNEFQQYSITNGAYEYYLYFRYFFQGCAYNSKNLISRLKCIKKMDQIGDNYSELDRFIDVIIVINFLKIVLL